MTPPIVPVRVSLYARLGSLIDSLVLKLVGLILFALGCYAEYREIAVPPTHTAHIIAWGGLIIVGLTFAFLRRSLAVLSGLAQIALPFVPGKAAARLADRLNDRDS